MRFVSLVVSAILISSCSTSPVYLADLEDHDYSDLDQIMDQLECDQYQRTFHLGRGAETEEEVLSSVLTASDSEVERAVAKAVQISEKIWVLASDSDQVLGALHTEGGYALCHQDILEMPTATVSS